MVSDTQYVRGAERLGRRIRTVRATLALPPMVAEIGELLLRRHQTRFDKQVDPDGKTWEPLSGATLARRKRSGGYPGKPILKQTEELRGAIRVIRSAVEEGASTYINTGAGLRIGVVGEEDLVGKARAHQKGRPDHGIPVRRFLGIGRLDVLAVDGLLRRAARKAGLP